MNIPVFVISLVDNNERRAHMTRLLNDHNISFQFFNAFDGRGKSAASITSLYSEEQAEKRLGYKMIGSQVATVISHLSLYKHILEQGHPYSLIMEDDIRITRSIEPILANINLLPEDWDVASLCYYRNSNTIRHYVISLRHRIPLACGFNLAYFTENMHSCAAYLVSSKGAANLVALLDAGFCEPIDHYVGNIYARSLFAIVPKPVEIDLQLGLASNVSRERFELSGNSPKLGFYIRFLLRRTGLFPLAKRTNLARLEWQKPFTQFFYLLAHPWLLFALPKRRYERSLLTPK
jgi:glycosyl transferase family 25